MLNFHAFSNVSFAGVCCVICRHAGAGERAPLSVLGGGSGVGTHTRKSLVAIHDFLRPSAWPVQQSGHKVLVLNSLSHGLFSCLNFSHIQLHSTAGTSFLAEMIAMRMGDLTC